MLRCIPRFLAANMETNTRTTVAVALTSLLIVGCPSYAEQSTSQNVQVSAPIDTESAAKGGDIAMKSVFKIICRTRNSSGTGFLHKSGNVITAAHVVKECPSPEIVLSTGSFASASLIASDVDLDIAVIAPTFPIEAQALKISSQTDFKVGDQVSTWGFPGGYGGLSPMLSVGYLSGVQAVKVSEKIVTQWVINAAFNRGNSGGPLLQIETGDVIGIVSSKVVPLSDNAKQALAILGQQQYGMQYQATAGDGSIKPVSEAQVVAMVLDELRNQVQLVIGNAVKVEDIRSFLSSQKIDP